MWAGVTKPAGYEWAGDRDARPRSLNAE